MSLLNGLVSVVTGGASGLGKETVKHLARHGGCVVLVDLPESRGKEVADEIVCSTKGNVLFAPCDVSKESDVTDALAICKDRYGRLDAAVNCAGIARAFKIANPLRGNIMHIDEIDTVYRSNVYGSFNVTRLAAKLMSENEPKNSDGQRGVIIYTGSVSAYDGHVGQSAFSAAKGAIAAMTLPISRDLASLGIRVMTIAPGLFETPYTAEYCLTEPVRQYLMEQSLFPKRFGDPSEFAQMVETIITNPMLNGEVLKISAGLRFHVDIRVPLSVENPELFVDHRRESILDSKNQKSGTAGT